LKAENESNSAHGFDEAAAMLTLGRHQNVQDGEGIDEAEPRTAMRSLVELPG
jgi:hypothetical protein